MGGEYAHRDVSNCNTYNYGDALYWDGRYLQEVPPYDWYQRYSALRPFVSRYIPKASRLLMLGCGTAVMSEEMINDGYEYVMNVDISSVAIHMMKKKNEHVPQLEYMQMNVTDMSFFSDESFDSAIDKGTLDSLMCGYNAPTNAASMLGEVNRLLKPGGIYMLVTYGDPTVRMLHLNRPQYNWKITLYIIPRPGFEFPSTSSPKSILEPVPLTDDGLLPPGFTLEDPESHYVYVCEKGRAASLPTD
ncbi:unnamed protein product [Victoria cruziana]